jgi:hypothetical protein
MSKGNATELDIVKVMYTNNFDPTWRTNANLYIALHTTDPGEAGDQTSGEVAYTNYARVSVVKTAVGWTCATDGGGITTAKNAGAITFNQCGVVGATAAYVSIGLSDTGVAGQILASGPLNSPLTISNLIQPQFLAVQLVHTED